MTRERYIPLDSLTNAERMHRIIETYVLDPVDRGFATNYVDSSTTDTTGVLNHRAFMDRLERDQRTPTYSDDRRKMGKGEFRRCILSMDIDDMKKVNDAIGHAGGDKVLYFLGKSIAENLRENDYAGRLSGGADEFRAVLKNISPQNAGNVAKRIQDKFSDYLAIEKLPKVTVIIGISGSFINEESDPLSRSGELVEACKGERSFTHFGYRINPLVSNGDIVMELPVNIDYALIQRIIPEGKNPKKLVDIPLNLEPLPNP